MKSVSHCYSTTMNCETLFHTRKYIWVLLCQWACTHFKTAASMFNDYTHLHTPLRLHTPVVNKAWRMSCTGVFLGWQQTTDIVIIASKTDSTGCIRFQPFLPGDNELSRAIWDQDTWTHDRDGWSLYGADDSFTTIHIYWTLWSSVSATKQTSHVVAFGNTVSF